MPGEEALIDYERIFQSTTTPCMIISPDLRILDANAAYLAATGTERSQIVGHQLFEAFPDDPGDPTADGTRRLSESLQTALTTGSPDTMPVQRYAIPAADGFEERYWSVVNIPVLSADEKSTMILHRAEDVTDLYRARDPDDDTELDLLKRAREVEGANRRLGEAKRRLERVVEEQQLVAALGQRALTSTDEGELFEQVTSMVLELADVDFCEVLERGTGGHALVTRTRAGWPAGHAMPAPAEAPTGSFHRFVMEAPDPVVVDDVSSDERFAAPAALVRDGVVAAVTVRIGDPSAPFGALAAYSRSRAAFGVEDGHFLLAVANVLAAGLERCRREEEMRRQALRDDLTGLPSRKLLLDRLARELAHARRNAGHGAFILIDLDNFKTVNDTLGHAAGDMVLKRTAERLTAALRDDDTVARLGGDEFGLLLPGVGGTEEAGEVARKVLEAIRAPVQVDGREVEVAASLGVALFPMHGDGDAVLLRRADAAMYVAKRAGTGHEIYQGVHDAHRHRRSGELADLRRAIEASELTVHYQPKLDLTADHVCSLEVLARWTHPQRGSIPPTEFIPLAEESGLIRELTAQVLDTALGQARRWLDQGVAVPVAVNLSAACVHDPSLIDMVMGSLAAAGMPASALELEITETAVMQSPGASMSVLGELSSADVRSSLDDFGTGYSSLAYLKRLPVHELKIDRSFMRDLNGSVRDASIVNAVIEMAHGLGLVVVAEGVETREICHALRERGCDRGQGYHFQRPLPAAEMTSWLLERQAAGPRPAA